MKNYENGYSMLESFRKTLVSHLEVYNKFTANNATALYEHNLGIQKEYFIHNNNNKFYCFIDVKHNYNLLFVFSLLDGKISQDFFIKTARIFHKPILLEGYMYTSKEEQCRTFSVTDLLVYNRSVASGYYNQRYKDLCELITPEIVDSVLTNMDNKVSITIHKVCETANSGKVDVESPYIEHVRGFYKANKRYLALPSTEVTVKVVSKGKFSDVYNVQDSATKNSEGLLYIKTISESKYLYNLFKTDPKPHLLDCVFEPSHNKFKLAKDVS